MTDEILNPINPLRNDLMDFDIKTSYTMKLPVSRNNETYTSIILVSIMDSLGGITNVSQTVFVGPNEESVNN
jgi:hypothetical protein